MNNEINSLLEELRKDKPIKSDSIKKEKIKLKNIDLFKIVSYAELCEELEIKELKLIDFKFLPEEQQEKALAYHQIQTIEKVYNGNWIKDFSNNSQYKYYPYFKDNGHGLVFAVCNFSYSVFYGMVAYFKDEKTSNFVGKTFIDIYKVLAK